MHCHRNHDSSRNTLNIVVSNTVQLTFIADIGNSIMDLPRRSPALRPDLSQHAFSSDLIVIFININVNLLKHCRLTFFQKIEHSILILKVFLGQSV